MKTKLLKTSLICLSAIVGGTAFAVDTSTYINPANAGYDPGQIDNTNIIQGRRYQRETKEYAETKEPAVIEEEVRQKMDLLNTEQVSFTLKNIKISGNTQFPTYALMRLVDFKIGQRVTINDLIMSANDITDYYQSKGYVSTVAYLPPQKVQNGTVEIKILEGKYGNVEINPGRWERSSYLNSKYLEDYGIAPGKVLNVNNVRNALTDMNTEEYMKGSIAFSDNEESEEYSDISLDVKDRFPLNFDIRYDNQGRDAIGTQRGVIYLGLHDVTGHGDTLMGTVSASHRSFGAGAIYSLPIAKNDTRLNLGYSYSKMRIGNGYGSDGIGLKWMNIKGDSNDYFIGISSRLLRGDDYRVYGDLTLDWRDTETTMFGKLYENRYRSRVIRGSITEVKDDIYGRWLLSGNIAGGLPIDASDYNKPRDLQSNNFVKLGGNLARLQVMPYNQLAILQVNGQYANRHLFAAEAMQIGGMSSVRGYDEGFLIGDYGVNASFEYRFPIPFLKAMLPDKYDFISDSIQLAGFYDFGLVGNRFQKDSYGYRTQYLQSIGAGTIIKLTKYMSANLYWGFPIGKSFYDYVGKDDYNRRACRFHFMLTSNIL